MPLPAPTSWWREPRARLLTQDPVSFQRPSPTCQYLVFSMQGTLSLPLGDSKHQIRANENAQIAVRTWDWDVRCCPQAL